MIKLIKNNVIATNVVSNLTGRGAALVIGVVSTPIYLLFIGTEGYGLIGFLLLFQTLMTVLDFGFSMTLMRLLSSKNRKTDSSQCLSALITIERIYIIPALIAFILFFSLADFIASNWLNIQDIKIEVVIDILKIISLIAPLQHLINLYTAAFMGLEKQFLVNVIYTGITFVKHTIGIIILYLSHSNLLYLFLYYAFLSAVHLFLLRYLLRMFLKTTTEATGFNSSLLRENLHFSIFTYGYSVIGLLISQLDKVFLSRYISLEVFGLYTIISMAASFILQVVSSISEAFYPQFTRFHCLKDKSRLIQSYKDSLTLNLFLGTSLGILFLFFAVEILQLLVPNAEASSEIVLAFSCLSLGSLLYTISCSAAYLQSASGRPSIIFFINLLSFLLLAPYIFYSAYHQNIVMVAAASIILNSIYCLFLLPLVHLWQFKEGFWNFIRETITMPVAVMIALAIISRILFFKDEGYIATLIQILIIYLIIAFGSLFATPNLSAKLLKIIKIGRQS